jgi:3-methylfumaryl-CoA hydratase
MSDNQVDDGITAAIGRSETAMDRIDLRQALHFQVTLDLEPTLEEGDPLPLFWEYLYFNPRIRASELGPDGHERLGRFVPDLGLPRRMWAGGGLEIEKPVLIGELVRKVSTIRSIERKTGRSGPLAFVEITHDYDVAGEHRFTEKQNVVYRGLPVAGTPMPPGKPAPEGGDFHREITPDPVLLFRYSALIFYGHRIHYDIDYARDVEGYPGLVVHGPLIATLLMDLGTEQLANRCVSGVTIRAMSPLFANHPFRLEGRDRGDTIDLWARGPEGQCAMTVELLLDAKE